MVQGAKHCPVCGSTAIVPFFVFDCMPVANNVLCKTYSDAVQFPTGKLRFISCKKCNFTWNVMFDSSLLNYDATYENNQSYSKTFINHLDTVIGMIPLDNSPLQIVEIGCGQGYFVDCIKTKLKNNVDCVVGFDPAVRLREREYLIPTKLDSRKLPQGVIPNFFISRHVIEHIVDVNAFLKDICTQLPSATGCLIETPSVSWIVKNRAFYDIYYEHCSLFSEYSLKIQLQKYGFNDCVVRNLFGGQYMVAISKKSNPISLDNTRTGWYDFSHFGGAFSDYMHSWSEKIRNLQSQYKKIAIWGAASKGVAFIQHMRKQELFFDCVIDINPHKQGCYIPCTGTPIVNPHEALKRHIDICIVANPVYLDEIEALCRTLSFSAKLLPLK